MVNTRSTVTVNVHNPHMATQSVPTGLDGVGTERL